MDEISELLRKLTPEMGRGGNASSPVSGGGASETGPERRLNLDRTAPPGLLPRSQRLQGAQVEPCELCGGAGFLLDDLSVGDPEYGTAVPCKCKLEERSQRRRSRFPGVNEPDALARFTFESFNPELPWLLPNERERLGRVYHAAVAFAETPEGWLFFTGGFGCGKTHLAAAIANRRLENGQQAIFVVAPDLLDHLRMTFGPSSEASYDELFDEVRRTELLVLDDLGAHSATPWAQEKLFQILNHRYNSRRPTVLTTNQRMEELDQRLRSRLLDTNLGNRIHITAPDFRVGGDPDELSTLRHHRAMVFERFEVHRRNTTRDDNASLQRALEAARAYAERPNGWFVLRGESGAGKTHLAAAICQSQDVAAQHEVWFVVVPDLLDHLRATFSPRSPVSYDRRFDELRRIPLLVLDDLGTESATPWAKEKLFQLLNHRYNAMLPTIITTSIGMEKFEPWLATRIRDISRCQVVEITVRSYRGGADQAEQVEQESMLRKPEEKDSRYYND